MTDPTDALAPDPPQDGGDAASGHAAEVAALFREHNRTLVNFLLARLKSEHDAREVAQEAYVRLLQLDRPGGVSFLRRVPMSCEVSPRRLLHGRISGFGCSNVSC